MGGYDQYLEDVIRKFAKNGNTVNQIANEVSDILNKIEQERKEEEERELKRQREAALTKENYVAKLYTNIKDNMETGCFNLEVFIDHLVLLVNDIYGDLTKEELEQTRKTISSMVTPYITSIKKFFDSPNLSSALDALGDFLELSNNRIDIYEVLQPIINEALSHI